MIHTLTLFLIKFLRVKYHRVLFHRLILPNKFALCHIASTRGEQSWSLHQRFLLTFRKWRVRIAVRPPTVQTEVSLSSSGDLLGERLLILRHTAPPEWFTIIDAARTIARVSDRNFIYEINFKLFKTIYFTRHTVFGILCSSVVLIFYINICYISFWSTNFIFSNSEEWWSQTPVCRRFPLRRPYFHFITFGAICTHTPYTPSYIQRGPINHIHIYIYIYIYKCRIHIWCLTGLLLFADAGFTLAAKNADGVFSCSR
jgi:hypothetical protein